MNIEKRSCLKRAHMLVVDEKAESLRYACLELRYCIEYIAYEKLRLYAKHIPAAALDVWQPRRVIDTLEEYDPLSNKTYALRIWSETPDGGRDKLIFLGEHRTLSPLVLKKYYNKLGNYLHVPTPAQAQKEMRLGDTELRDYLRELIALLEPVSKNAFDINVATVVNFECQECGQPIIRNAAGLRKSPVVTCLAESCLAQHEAYEEDGNWFIRLSQAEFICPDCNTKNYVALHRMAEGSRFKCVECKTQYVVDRKWVCLPAQSTEGET